MSTKLRRALIVGSLALSPCAPASAVQNAALTAGEAAKTSQTLREAILRSAPINPKSSAEPSPTAWQGPRGRLPRIRTARSRRSAWICLGAAGGMIAGGYLGMKIEGDGCRCDDPGLKGYAIGLSIGGLLGGLAGAAIGSR